MSDYTEEAKRIPWKSLGRETTVSRIGRSLLPVGVLPFTPLYVNPKEIPVISNDHPDSEKFLMNIIGTAIQAAKGKLVTCLHVAETLAKQKCGAYLLARLFRTDSVRYMPYPLQHVVRYLDPRTNRGNASVDLAVLICAVKNTPELPYEIPPVEWGDSSEVGVGDSVVVGGYPHGTEMFKFTKTNRGLIQPTFYHGIISAIIPALQDGETRIIQISVACAGGMSGGAVFNPETGKVIGMITSCVHAESIPQPISYALLSEIIAPFVNTIRVQTTSGDWF